MMHTCTECGADVFVDVLPGEPEVRYDRNGEGHPETPAGIDPDACPVCGADLPADEIIELAQSNAASDREEAGERRREEFTVFLKSLGKAVA